ncbi:DUF402 domain-containing protein [Sutcliffiella horikoshii]|uniref:DUF402 domain-containing protein n=1 Tax=Sutcliffiella horikoshii TaxID=79883 RepID=UPI00203AC0B4|nr:DUF402 domain-containing protein [Sutcliffiella horikoshii]MCM3617674.1 DUF402 domain-containing protein [Sutcliffiella horikoshii]
MLKRKYGDRSEWKRVLKRKYAQSYLDTKEFKGYITLLHTIKVTEPLSVRYGEHNICIVNDGYMWLQQFPLDKKHAVTTMFDANGNIVQWYIDICLENGIDEDTPWMDDLFLDIVLLPTGEVIQKDHDELEEALDNGIIDNSLFSIAWDEANYLTELINTRNFELLNLSNKHKEILVGKLK